MALYLWPSDLYEQRTLLAAGDVVASVPLAGGGEVQVAAQTTLTAVVRKAVRAGRSLSLPAPLRGAAAGRHGRGQRGLPRRRRVARHGASGGRAESAAAAGGIAVAGGVTGRGAPRGFAVRGAGVTDANGAGRPVITAPRPVRARPALVPRGPTA